MMDILLKEKLSQSQISKFLCNAFECGNDDILIIGLNEFNATTMIELETKENILKLDHLRCLCIVSDISGDATFMLQLYRYSIPDEKLMQRLIRIANRDHILFYYSTDNFNGWALVGKNEIPLSVKEIYSDDQHHIKFECIGD